MALPLPSVVPNIAPGGPLVTSIEGENALLSDIYGNQIRGVQAQYAPITTLADALSKSAYANMVMPQALAKFLGHTDILANDPNAQADINRVLSVGSPGTATNALQNAIANNLNNLNVNYQPKSLGEMAVNKLMNILGGNKPQPSSNNSLLQTPVQQQMPSSQGSNVSTNGYSLNPASNEIIQATDAWIKSPQGQASKQQTGSYNIPQTQPLLTWYRGQQDNQQVAPQVQPVISPVNNQAQNVAENTGEYKGTIAQQEEEGKARGQVVAQLGKDYAQDVDNMAPIQHLIQLSQDPTFMNMRNSIPYFQNLQLANLSKIGNPDEQKVIGDFIVSAKQAQANAVNSFKGRAMAKEFDFASQMKISDNDTIGVILGKLQALATYKQATMQRNRVASDLIENKHLNEGDAYEQANKQVDMDAIRSQISQQLQSPIQIRNKKTGEIKYISPSQYNDMLGKGQEK